MPDPLFQQTVILMLPPSELPIVAGIVINKPTKMTLGQLFSHSPAIRNQAQSVYFGGPVDLTSPAILMRASRAPDATTRLFENVYMSDDAAPVRAFLERQESDKDLRLFLGRAQWTVDQLHSEIISGAWVVPRLALNSSSVPTRAASGKNWCSRPSCGKSSGISASYLVQQDFLLLPPRYQHPSARGAKPHPNK
jgi:putative AlgH/UPF0301 family transcriptional regulator